MTGAVPAAANATLHGCIGLAPDGDPQDGVEAGAIIGAALVGMPTRSAKRHCSRGPASCSTSAATMPVATITPRAAAPPCARRAAPARGARRRLAVRRDVISVDSR